MMIDPAKEKALNTFLDDWPDSPEKNREVFILLKNFINAQNGVTLDFIPRPGVTYSLRAVHADQKNRDLFVMVDVIEDTPRWLSVCFYADMITDPEEKGDFVPEGLLGEDAVCFDIEAQDQALIGYIEARMGEASLNAADH